MILKEFEKELSTYKLFIGENNKDDIFKLYESNEYYAKVSNTFPVKMEAVIEDINVVPPCSDKEHKYYLSIYNEQNRLVAVVDFIDSYTYKHVNNLRGIWIGLLKIHGDFHKKGIGHAILGAFEKSCRVNGKEEIQLGVIKDNEIGLKFWEKEGYKIFKEVNNGEHDLKLMRKFIQFINISHF
jgi:ribosomal protein S18 acetylase RimI-like enzyme